MALKCRARPTLGSRNSAEAGKRLQTPPQVGKQNETLLCYHLLFDFIHLAIASCLISFTISTMATTNSTNSTCVFDEAFHRVTDPNYNWTQARHEYMDSSQGRTSALKDLFTTRLGDTQYSTNPGCFYLGTATADKVKQCEDGGGMAVITSYTHHIMDADVWFCALRGWSGKVGSQAPSPLTDDDLFHMKGFIKGPEPLTCNMPSQNSAVPRAALSRWLPLLAVGLTSVVALS